MLFVREVGDVWDDCETGCYDQLCGVVGLGLLFGVDAGDDPFFQPTF
jgi:hypothetical protein